MVEDLNIKVDRLSISFPTKNGLVSAVSDVTAVFKWGRFTAIIGESGCGKSVLGQAILGILPGYANANGAIWYRGRNIVGSPIEISHYYGKEISVVPQNPGDAMNPVRKIGKQFEDILEAVGIRDPENKLKQKWLRFFGLEDISRILMAYPYELSGGMQQRVLCGMSMCCSPKWILADEPTKGLDETVGKVVKNNLLKVKQEGSCGMIIITHDIELAKDLCDTVAVMYAGQILEMGSHIFDHPLHPYTQGFLQSLPQNGFIPMKGKTPMPGEKIPGCRFAARCPYVNSSCTKKVPSMKRVKDTDVRCIRYASR